MRLIVVGSAGAGPRPDAVRSAAIVKAGEVLTGEAGRIEVHDVSF